MKIPAERKQRNNYNVPRHRRCPSCWGNLKGVGFVKSSRPIQVIGGRRVNKRYYYCDTCSNPGWAVTVRPAEVFPGLEEEMEYRS